MKERVNLIKDVVLMKIGGDDRKKQNLSKKQGLTTMEIIVICAIIFIVGAALKEPITTFASWVITEVTRIGKSWFTGL